MPLPIPSVRIVPAVLALVALIAAPAAPAAQYSVTEVRFDNAVSGPSPLARRLAREQGRAPPPGRRAVTLRGRLYRPAAPGPHPALVLLHDCRGVRPYQQAWAGELAEWGYVALLVDSFTPRGVRNICPQLVDIEARDVYGGRVFDAFGARDYLAARPFVDAGRIGVIGWAYDAVLATVIRDGAQQFFAHGFGAAVALYPDCGFTITGDFVAPVLVLAGAADDWTPARVCRRMHQRSLAHAHPVRLRVYAGAAHGFDDHELGAGVFLPAVRNLYRQPALGANLRYDARAHRAARRDVRAFLAAHLHPR